MFQVLPVAVADLFHHQVEHSSFVLNVCLGDVSIYEKVEQVLGSELDTCSNLSLQIALASFLLH